MFRGEFDVAFSFVLHLGYGESLFLPRAIGLYTLQTATLSLDKKGVLFLGHLHCSFDRLQPCGLCHAVSLGISPLCFI